MHDNLEGMSGRLIQLLAFLQKFFQGQNLLLCKRLLFSDQNFRRRVRMTAKVIPTQKWSPRCDGLVDWLYAVQDLMCYYIMHCNDKIQVSVENCSKCLASLTLQQFIHKEVYNPRDIHTPFSLLTRLQYSHLQIHCLNSWKVGMLCWHVECKLQLLFHKWLLTRYLPLNCYRSSYSCKISV